MELIVISDPVAVADEAKIINGLFQSGLKRFHLRKPDWDKFQLIALLMQIEPEFYPAIALHQHHSIAARFGIKRLHYSEEERLNAEPEQLLHLARQGYTLSTSVHDVLTLAETGLFNDVFFGPVFNSISKPGYETKLPGDFYLDKTGIKNNVIALGGVTEANLYKISQMNFDGAAVLGSIWQHPNQALQMLASFQTLTNNLM